MDQAPNPYSYLKKEDHEAPTTSNSSLIDADNMSDIDVVSVYDQPLFITDLGPLCCKNTGCANPLKVTTRQCIFGHVFCHDCHKGQINCMLCPESEPKKKLFPSVATDAILNTIMDVCPNKTQGCKKKFPFYKFDEHIEEHCECSHLMCPVSGCFKLFSERFELEEHIVTIHKEHVD